MQRRLFSANVLRLVGEAGERMTVEGRRETRTNPKGVWEQRHIHIRLKSQAKGSGFMEKWQSPGQEQEKHEMSLSTSSGQKVKSFSRTDGGTSHGCRSQPESLTTSHIWDTLTPKEVMMAPDGTTR